MGGFMLRNYHQQQQLQQQQHQEVICRPARRWGDGAGVFTGVLALMRCLSKSKPFQQASSCDVKPDTHEKFISEMGNRPRQAAM